MLGEIEQPESDRATWATELTTGKDPDGGPLRRHRRRHRIDPLFSPCSSHDMVVIEIELVVELPSSSVVVVVVVNATLASSI